MANSLIWPVLGGVTGIPIGAVACTAMMYAVLASCGVTEMEGRRGVLAGVYGIVPGAVAGFVCGFQLVQWLMTRYLPWRAVIAGASAGTLLAVALFITGLVAGIHWAEARGVSNYAGERGAWALFYVAMPAATLGGIGGFFCGRWLAGG